MFYLVREDVIEMYAARYPALSIILHGLGELQPSSASCRFKSTSVLAELLMWYEDEGKKAIFDVIDEGVRSNWIEPGKLLTSSLNDFWSMMDGVFLMKDFIRRGFSVHSLDFSVSGITTDRVADFEISIGERRASVEVYSPQQWSLIKEFERSLHDSLIHFDSPFSYFFTIGAIQESRIRSGMNYVSDPAMAHRVTSHDDLNDAIRNVLLELSHYLNKGNFVNDFHCEITIPGMGFEYKVTVKQVAKLENELNRDATDTNSVGMPGTYLEDAFRNFCLGKLAAKIRKNQAGQHETDYKFLFVNIHGMDVMHSYRADEYHTKQAQMILTQSVSENENYDAISFFLYRDLQSRHITFPIEWHKQDITKTFMLGVVSARG